MKPLIGHSTALALRPQLALLLVSALALASCGGGNAPSPETKSTQLDAVTAAAGGASSVRSAGVAVEPEAAASAAEAASSASGASLSVATGPTAKISAVRTINGDSNKGTSTATSSVKGSAADTAPAVVAAALTKPAALAESAPGTGAQTATVKPAPANGTNPTPAQVATASAAQAPASTASTPATPPIVYAGPQTITKGGVYSGNWESTNPATPAVTINTMEPVTFQNCNIRSVGRGFQSFYSGTTITIQNCKVALNTPNVAGKSAERFAAFFAPKSLIIEGNTVVGGLGIYVDGNGKGADLLRIRYNKQTNIDGRQSDGKGGFAVTFNIGQFVQFNNILGIKDGEISWNQVVNEPGKSRVEDNINLYLTRGLATRKYPVQNNYIQGAYPANPTKDNFSGGGIIVDGSAKTADTASGYISITGNQVVSTTNYGIAISAGINSEIKGNRVISTGALPSGERIAAANVGLYIWDISNNASKGSFAGNVANSNEVYWLNAKAQRNDAWFPNCAPAGCTVNTSLSASALTGTTKGLSLLSTTSSTAASTSVEDVEFSSWQAKLTSGTVKVGAQ